MMRGYRLAEQCGDPARLAAYQASYHASVKEVSETTTAEGPFDKTGLDARFSEGCWRASPPVWQGDPAHIGDLAHGKWRPVDDATRSKINASFRPIEKVSFPRLGYCMPLPSEMGGPRTSMSEQGPKMSLRHFGIRGALSHSIQ